MKLFKAHIKSDILKGHITFGQWNAKPLKVNTLNPHWCNLIIPSSWTVLWYYAHMNRALQRRTKDIEGRLFSHYWDFIRDIPKKDQKRCAKLLLWFFFYSSLNRRLLLSRPSCTWPVCGSNRLWEAGELWDKPACGAGGGGHWEKWVWQVSYRIRTYILYISLMFSLWQIAAFTVQQTCYVKCWCGTHAIPWNIMGVCGIVATAGLGLLPAIKVELNRFAKNTQEK